MRHRAAGNTKVLLSQISATMSVCRCQVSFLVFFSLCLCLILYKGEYHFHHRRESVYIDEHIHSHMKVLRVCVHVHGNLLYIRHIYLYVHFEMISCMSSSYVGLDAFCVDYQRIQCNMSSVNNWSQISCVSNAGWQGSPPELYKDDMLLSPDWFCFFETRAREFDVVYTSTVASCSISGRLLRVQF